MSHAANAIDAIAALEAALTSQIREPIVAPTILIEVYQEGDGFVFTIFENGDRPERIGGPAPSLTEAAKSIARQRA